MATSKKKVKKLDDESLLPTLIVHLIIHSLTYSLCYYIIWLKAKSLPLNTHTHNLILEKEKQEGNYNNNCLVAMEFKQTLRV